jgi:hypothetical protein
LDGNPKLFGCDPIMGTRSGFGSVISRPSTPRPVGRAPICFSSSGIIPAVMNSAERRSILVEYTESAVASVGHRNRLVDDVAKQDREFEIRLNQQGCFEDSS